MTAVVGFPPLETITFTVGLSVWCGSDTQLSISKHLNPLIVPNWFRKVQIRYQNDKWQVTDNSTSGLRCTVLPLHQSTLAVIFRTDDASAHNYILINMLCLFCLEAQYNDSFYTIFSITVLYEYSNKSYICVWQLAQVFLMASKQYRPTIHLHSILISMKHLALVIL